MVGGAYGLLVGFLESSKILELPQKPAGLDGSAVWINMFSLFIYLFNIFCSTRFGRFWDQVGTLTSPQPLARRQRPLVMVGPWRGRRRLLFGRSTPGVPARLPGF